MKLGLLHNECTYTLEMVELAPEKLETIVKFFRCLLKQYGMLLKEKGRADKQRIAQLQDAVFSNPIFRQVLISVNF